MWKVRTVSWVAGELTLRGGFEPSVAPGASSTVERKRDPSSASSALGPAEQPYNPAQRWCLESPPAFTVPSALDHERNAARDVLRCKLCIVRAAANFATNMHQVAPRATLLNTVRSPSITTGRSA